MRETLKRSLIGLLMAIATVCVANNVLGDVYNVFIIPYIILVPIAFKYLLGVKIEDTYLNVVLFYLCKGSIISALNKSINLGENAIENGFLNGLAVAVTIFGIQSIVLYICEKIDEAASKRKKKDEEKTDEKGIWFGIRFIAMYVVTSLILMFLNNYVICYVVNALGKEATNFIASDVMIYVTQMSLIIVLNLAFIKLILDNLFKEKLTIEKLQNFTLIVILGYLVFFATLVIKNIEANISALYMAIVFSISSIVYVLDRIRRESIALTKKIPKAKLEEMKKEQSLKEKVVGKKMALTFMILYLVCMVALVSCYFTVIRVPFIKGLSVIVNNDCLTEVYGLLMDYALLILYNYIFIKIVINILMDKYRPTSQDMMYFKAAVSIMIALLFLVLAVKIFVQHIIFQQTINTIALSSVNKDYVFYSVALFKFYDFFNVLLVIGLYFTTLAYIFFRVKMEAKRLTEEAREKLAKRSGKTTTKKEVGAKAETKKEEKKPVAKKVEVKKEEKKPVAKKVEAKKEEKKPVAKKVETKKEEKKVTKK